MIRILLIAAVALSGWLMVPDPARNFGFVVATAWADDDDDDDDDAPVRRRPAPVRAAPLPAFAPNEVLAHGLIESDIARLESEGFALLQTRVLVDGAMSHRLRKPARLSMLQARAHLRQEFGKPADFNHYYRPNKDAANPPACKGSACPAREMLDWPQATSGCGTPPLIGMVDTGLNPDHAVFADAAIELHRIGPKANASGLIHGTAVASLLVGDPASRTPGLVPGARLIAVDAFHKAKSDERMDAFSLIEALDLLAQKGVRIINLSFAGPENAALAEQLRALDHQGIVLVAAAGNSGPAAKPAYPAAYDIVVAVTAVDRRSQIYRRANRGEHIDLAAPGVEVWTATSVSGARTQTGTSFAAPFVTAAAALLLQKNPQMTPSEVRRALENGATDLGRQGPDAVFGHGLIAPPNPCS